MYVGQNGKCVGANFIGYITVGCDSVRTYNNRTDLILSTKKPDGCIRNDCMGDVFITQLPRSKPSTLTTWLCFWNQNVHFLPDRWAAYMGARALPQSTNASHPALQNVRT